ncbi:MAG TPA: hypothetical protein VLA04_05715 [Verrucomicrobiae bacterium]|nr:hypothetical protein [Verrucomicrobiae bacterium]
MINPLDNLFLISGHGGSHPLRDPVFRGSLPPTCYAIVHFFLKPGPWNICALSTSFQGCLEQQRQSLRVSQGVLEPTQEVALAALSPESAKPGKPMAFSLHRQQDLDLCLWEVEPFWELQALSPDEVIHLIEETQAHYDMRLQSADRERMRRPRHSGRDQFDDLFAPRSFGL